MTDRPGRELTEEQARRERARRFLTSVDGDVRAAVDLAVALSPAGFVEPSLLRAVRLEVFPAMRVQVEADVWFSPLVHERSPEGFAFAPEAVPLLHDRLRQWLASGGTAGDVARRAAEIVLGREADPLRRSGERVTWWLLSDPGAAREQVASELEPIVAALERGDQGTARWVLRVADVLPPGVWSFAVARAAAETASRVAGRPVPDVAAGVGATRVYVSYAHADARSRVPVHRFCELLREQGLDVHVGEETDERGWAEIRDRVHGADAFLVIASERYRRMVEEEDAPGGPSGTGLEVAALGQRMSGTGPFPVVLGVVLPGASVDDLPSWVAPHGSTYSPDAAYVLTSISAPAVEPLALRLQRAGSGRAETAAPPVPARLPREPDQPVAGGPVADEPRPEPDRPPRAARPRQTNPDRRPVFYVSWAHGDVAELAQELVGRFYSDLSGHVRQLVGSRSGDPVGMIDMGVHAGGSWEDQLLQAVGTCGVFVALISPDYVHSEYCGREWDLFTRRRLVEREPRPAGHPEASVTGVLPVIWAPLPPSSVPPAVARVQRFSPRANGDGARDYENSGLYGLMVTRSDDYQVAVWDLARRVSSLFFDFELEPLSGVDWSDARNAFAEE